MTKCFYIYALLIILSACMKSETPAGTASLTIENTVPNSLPLVSNFDDGQTVYWYKTAPKITYGAYTTATQFRSYSGTKNLALYQYPDTTEHDQPLVRMSLRLDIGKIYSLYVTGTVDHPDTVFTEDHLPYHAVTDSTMGLRFTNLSPGSNPVSINLTGQPHGGVVASLPFKGVTDFKIYSARSSVTSMLFEIRDVATDTLITTYKANNISAPGASYSPNTWMYKNNTLALIGLPGGTGTTIQKIMLIRNF